MTIFKYILLIFLLICLIILQISFLSRRPAGAFWNPTLINLIFVLMLLFLIFDQFKYAFLIALVGGLLLDLYSILVPGLYLVTFMIVLIASNKLIKKFSSMRLPSVLIFALVSSFIYQISILAVSWLAYLLNLQDNRIIFNKYYWLTFLGALIFNSLVISGGFLMVKIYGSVRNPIKRRRY